MDSEISKIVENLIKTKPAVEFLVGRNCDFDIVVSRIINRVQDFSKSGNNKHICIIPLPKWVYNDDNYEFYFHCCGDDDITYSSVEIFPETAIKLRNIEMINRSDLCLFYVDRNYGRTWQTMQYALSKNKEIINIADLRTIHNFHPSWMIW